uniref:Uncharacterized protein n=1 Tax=Caenorhabditis japonica TaxID=281687 RepID=A0A8R1HKC7_CAEJA
MVAQQAVMREWCLLGGGAATTMRECPLISERCTTVNREEAAELLKNLTVADDGTIHHVLKRYRIVFQESSRLLGSPSGTLTVCCFYEPFIVVGNYLEEIAGRTGAENSIIVTLIEVLNIIAHIGCGWVADQPEVSVLVVNYIALMMAGLDTMIFPFYTEYWSFLVFFVLFSIGVVWRYSGSRWNGMFRNRIFKSKIVRLWKATNDKRRTTNN